MSGTVSKDTASRIWRAHHDIEEGEKLVAAIKEQLARGEDAKPTDAFGRRRGYEFGMPTGTGHRLMDVSPVLAAAIIQAHVEDKRRDLAEASIAAAVEANGANTSIPHERERDALISALRFVMNTRGRPRREEYADGGASYARAMDAWDEAEVALAGASVGRGE